MIRLLALLIISFLLLSSGKTGPIRIVAKWEMPEILREISGIAYIDKSHFACVQDEAGTIFIYNTSTQKIDKEINFTGPGDFEGICLQGKTAWIIRSDGKLYEVDDINTKNPRIAEYPSGLRQRQEVEGICYDKENNRLLVSIKEAGRGDQTYKGIYGFDLNKKQFYDEPVLKINLQDDIFRNAGQKKGHLFFPSDINIHPTTGEFFITDGSSTSKLLIMDKTGSIKKLVALSGREFSKPEGICFDPEGKIYISNEGITAPGNILEVVFE